MQEDGSSGLTQIKVDRTEAATSCKEGYRRETLYIQQERWKDVKKREFKVATVERVHEMTTVIY